MFSSNLSVLQRRSLRLFSGTIIVTGVLAFADGRVFKYYHPLGASAYLIATLPAIPFLGALLITGRYLAEEKDEFARMLFTQALLWGFGVTMAVDVIWGFLSQFCSVAAPPAFLNIDLVMCSALIALHILPARYQ